MKTLTIITILLFVSLTLTACTEQQDTTKNTQTKTEIPINKDLKVSPIPNDIDTEKLKAESSNNEPEETKKETTEDLDLTQDDLDQLLNDLEDIDTENLEGLEE